MDMSAGRCVMNEEDTRERLRDLAFTGCGGLWGGPG